MPYGIDYEHIPNSFVLHKLVVKPVRAVLSFIWGLEFALILEIGSNNNAKIWIVI